MFTRMNRIEFNSNSSWVAPAGVTKVILVGMGGGSGGNGGMNGSAGAGGKGGDGGVATSMQSMIVDVVPNTTYNITIGAGGTGGAAQLQGGNGGNTTFGGLFTFYGAASGIFVGSQNANASSGVYTFPQGNKSTGNTEMTLFPRGGVGIAPNFSGYVNGTYGYANILGIYGGVFPLNYSASSTLGGVGGGGMSGLTTGPSGGYGRLGLAGTVGGSGTANSGSGGAGGGGGSSGSTAGGAGGDGGSGKLIVFWVE